MALSPETTRIAFIGTGVMGCSMCGHLMDAGYSATVYNRTKDRAMVLCDAGAAWADTVAEAVADADVVITIVGYPADVEEVYLGEGGILASAKPGAYLIDMTTSSPKLANDIWTVAEASGFHAVDAPVSGGDLGAKNATLTIMVGGNAEDYEAILPILEVMGKCIVRHGPAGAGQHAKMANQIAIAGSMLALVECLSYGQAAGLDSSKVLESITAGSATSWSLENYGPRILNDDFKPGFFVKHFIKDMNIAIDEAEEMGISLYGLGTAKYLYDLLAAVGGNEMGTQALYLLYADEATGNRFGLDWTQVELDEDDDHGCGCGCGDHHHHAYDGEEPDWGDDDDEDEDGDDDDAVGFSDNPFVSEN